MTSAPVPLPFEGFRRLGSAVYLYEPVRVTDNGSPSTTTTTTAATAAPDLLLFCSWLDAAPKHIAKYLSAYRALYPHLRILLVTTNLAAMSVQSAPARERARLEPAVAFLQANTQTSPPPRILLHLFSNGGAYTAAGIAREYRTRCGRVVPLAAQVQDSSPGQFRYGYVKRALAVSLPRGLVLRALGWVLLYLLIAWYVLVVAVTRGEYMNAIFARELNDARLFDEDAPRLYFYSRADEMVSWEDVEQHAAEARALGYRVCMEEFVGSGHCGHLLRDPERYWAAVRAVLEE